MTITLRSLTVDNLSECFLLQVSDQQRNHAQIEETPDMIENMIGDSSCVPLTIYSDDTMVGLIAYALVEGTSDYRIQRILIDEKYQRRGYGESAMRQVIEQLSHKTDCERIIVSYMSFNEPAINLYEKLGFVETDEFCEAGELENKHGEKYAVYFNSPVALDAEIARIQRQIEQLQAQSDKVQSRRRDGG